MVRFKKYHACRIKDTCNGMDVGCKEDYVSNNTQVSEVSNIHMKMPLAEMIKIVGGSRRLRIGFEWAMNHANDDFTSLEYKRFRVVRI